LALMAAAWRGGDRLEAYLEQASNKLGKASQVSVGFLEGATEADGTSIPMIAAIQNFGAPSVGIPPRPFFTNMVEQHKDEWGEQMSALMDYHGYDAGKVLNLMGELIGGELRQSIKDTNEPALSPVTLMLRQMRADNPNLVVNRTVVKQAADRVAAGKPYKSTGTAAKPLIDTGTMWQSVDYEVS
jgi:hypothetical protein